MQESLDKEPIYLKGTCVLSRSPVIHPGDGTSISVSNLPLTPRSLVCVVVQRVTAVGKPPDDKICFFNGLKNVVVLPAVGV